MSHDTQVKQEDNKAIHDLFSEFHYADNLGVLKIKLAEYVATVRREEREAAFKILCPDCAEGDTPTYDSRARWHYHRWGSDEVFGCSASKLRIGVEETMCGVSVESEEGIRVSLLPDKATCNACEAAVWGYQCGRADERSDAAPASPAALGEQSNASRSVLAEIETALLSINNGVSPQVAVGQVFAIINNERAGLGAAVATRDEAETDSCSHWREGDSDNCVWRGVDLGPTTEADVAATTPPSTLAKAAAEIVRYFRDLASYGDIREPDESLLITKVLEMLSGTASGEICKSHGLAVLVTHVNDGEPCSDYLHAAIIERCFSAESES